MIAMIMRKKGKLNRGLKVTALAVTLFFTWNTIAFSDGSGIFLSIVSGTRQAVPGRDDTSFHSNDILHSIKIPSELGQVKRAFRGSGKGTVIHIQDAHVNEEAQRNIAGIMDYFFKEHQVRLANVEGASGELAHHLLSAFPDTNARSLLADYFLREARITGPEYLALSKRPELVLYGIEEPELYEANRKAFLAALDFKQRDEVILKQLRKVMESASRYVLSENLWDLIREKQRFEKEETDFVSYVRYLKSLADKWQVQEPFPQISAFINLLESQNRLDLEKTEAEVDLAVKKLKEFLSGNDLLLFIKNTGEFQSNKMARENYYRYLGALLPKAGTAMSFSHLAQYLEHMRLSESIGIEIFDEMKKLEDLLKEKMIRSEEERMFDRLFHFLEIYEKMFDFALTKEDAEFFYENRSQFESKTFSRFLTPLLEKYHFDQEIKNLSLTPLDEDLPKIESFYELAMKRDEILIANALKKMEQEKQETSIIVTGGFHTSGLEKRLQALGFSYVIVTPRIAKAMNEAKESERYAKAMRSEPTRLATLLSEAYFPQVSGRANDPRYQLGTPSGFSTYGELARAFSRPETRDFNPRMLVREFPALDLTFTGAVLLTGIFAALGKEFQGVEGKISSDMLNKILGAMSPYLKDEEKPWAPLLYMPLLTGTRQGAAATGSLVSQGFGDGASLTAVWNSKRNQAEVSTLKPGGAVFEINGLLLEIRLQERGLAIDVSERTKAPGIGETEWLAPKAPTAHPFQVLIQDQALEDKISYEVLKTLNPVEREGRLLAWTLVALALHFKEIKAEAIKQGMYQGPLKRAVEDTYTLSQMGSVMDPKNAESLIRYLDSSFRFIETLPEGEKITPEHYQTAYKDLFDPQGALSKSVATLQEAHQEVLSHSLAKGIGINASQILGQVVRSELRRPAAEKKAVPQFKFNDLFDNETDEADAQIFSHGKLAGNIAGVFERAGIDLSSTISRRAYWLTSEGNKVDRLAEGETAAKRVYKLIAETSEGRKNFILEINGFVTGPLKAKFRSYTAELNQLDEAIRNSVDQEGNPAGIQKIFGREISNYAKVVIPRENLGRPDDTKIYDMNVTKVIIEDGTLKEKKEADGVRVAVKAVAEETPLTSLLTEKQKEGYPQEVLYKTKIAGASHALGVYLPQAPAAENLPVVPPLESSVTLATDPEVFSPEVSLPPVPVEVVQMPDEQAAEKRRLEEEALKQLQAEREQIQTAVKQASDDLNNLENLLTTTAQAFAKQITEIMKAKDRQGILQRNSLELDQQIQEKKQDFETLKQEMTATKLEASKKATTSLETARNELVQLEKNKEILNTSIAGLTSRQKSLSKTVKGIGRKVADLKKAQAVLKNENLKLSKEKLQTAEDVALVQAQVAAERDRLGQLKDEITSFVEKKSQQEALLAVWIEELKKKNTDARANYDKLVSDGQALEAQIQESRRQFTIEEGQKAAQLTAIEDERQKVEGQVTKAQEDLRQLLGQINETKQKAAADLIDQKNKYSAIGSAIETGDRELTRLNQEIEKETGRLESLISTIEDTTTKTGLALSEQIGKQKITLAGLEATQKTLEIQVDKLTQSKTQIDTEIESVRLSLEQMNQALTQTEKTLQERRKVLEAIDGEIKTGRTLSQKEFEKLAGIQRTIAGLRGTVTDLTTQSTQAASLKNQKISALEAQVETLGSQKATLERDVQEVLRGGVRQMRELYRAGLGEEIEEISRKAKRDLRPDDLLIVKTLIEKRSGLRSEIRMELDSDEEDAADVLKGILAEQAEDDRIFSQLQQNYKEGIQLRLQEDLENLQVEIARLATLEGFDLESRIQNINQKYTQEIEQVKELEIYEELLPALENAIASGKQKAAAAYEKRSRLLEKENRVAELQRTVQALMDDKTPGQAALNLSRAADLQNQMLEIRRSLGADETSPFIQGVLDAAPQIINAFLQSYQKELVARVQNAFQMLRKTVLDLETVEGFKFEEETAKIQETFAQELNQFSAFEFSPELAQAFTQAIEKTSEEVRTYFLIRELDSGFAKEFGAIGQNIASMSRTNRYESFQADLEATKNGFLTKIITIRSRPDVSEDIEAPLVFLSEQIQEAEKDLNESYAHRQERFKKEEAIETVYLQIEQLEKIEDISLRPANLFTAVNLQNQIGQLDETQNPGQGTEATLRMIANAPLNVQAIERRYLAGLKNRLDESVRALAGEVKIKEVKAIKLGEKIESLFGSLTKEVRDLKGTEIGVSANQMVNGVLKKEVEEIRQQFSQKRMQLLTPRKVSVAPQALPVKVEPVKAPVILEVQKPLPAPTPLPSEAKPIQPETKVPEAPPKKPKAREAPKRERRIKLGVEGLEDRTAPAAGITPLPGVFEAPAPPVLSSALESETVIQMAQPGQSVVTAILGTPKQLPNPGNQMLPADVSGVDMFFTALGQENLETEPSVVRKLDQYFKMSEKVGNEPTVSASMIASLLQVELKQELIVKDANGETIAFAALEYDAQTGQTTFIARDFSGKEIANIPLLPTGNYVFDLNSEPVVLGEKGQLAVSLQLVDQEEGTKLTVVFGIGIGEEKPEAEPPSAGKPAAGIDPLVFRILFESEAQRRIIAPFSPSGSSSITGVGSGGGGAAGSGGSSFAGAGVGSIEIQYDPLARVPEIETLENLSAKEIFGEEAPSEISARLVFALAPGPEEQGYYQMIIQDGAQSILVPLHEGMVPISSKVVNFLKEGSRPEGKNNILFRLEVDGQILTFVYDRQARKVTAVVRTLQKEIEQELEEKEKREAAPKPQIERPEMKPQEKEEEVIPILGRAPDELPSSQASIGVAAVAALFMTGLTQEAKKKEEKEIQPLGLPAPSVEPGMPPTSRVVLFLQSLGLVGQASSAGGTRAPPERKWLGLFGLLGMLAFALLIFGFYFKSGPGETPPVIPPSIEKLVPAPPVRPLPAEKKEDLLPEAALPGLGDEAFVSLLRPLREAEERPILEQHRELVRDLRGIMRGTTTGKLAAREETARQDLIPQVKQALQESLGLSFTGQEALPASQWTNYTYRLMQIRHAAGNPERERLFLNSLRSGVALAKATLQDVKNSELPSWLRDVTTTDFLTPEEWQAAQTDAARAGYTGNVSIRNLFALAEILAASQYQINVRYSMPYSASELPDWSTKSDVYKKYAPNNFVRSFMQTLHRGRPGLQNLREAQAFEDQFLQDYYEIFYGWAYTSKMKPYELQNFLKMRSGANPRLMSALLSMPELWPYKNRSDSADIVSSDMASVVLGAVQEINKHEEMGDLFGRADEDLAQVVDLVQKRELENLRGLDLSTLPWDMFRMRALNRVTPDSNVDRQYQRDASTRLAFKISNETQLRTSLFLIRRALAERDGKLVQIVQTPRGRRLAVRKLAQTVGDMAYLLKNNPDLRLNVNEVDDLAKLFDLQLSLAQSNVPRERWIELVKEAVMAERVLEAVAHARSEVRDMTRRGFLGGMMATAAAAVITNAALPFRLISAEAVQKEAAAPPMAAILKALFSRLNLSRTDRQIMAFQRKVIASNRKGVRLIKIKHRKPARTDFVEPAREIFGQLGFEMKKENEFWAEDFADILTFQMNAIGILGNAQMEKIFLTSLKSAFPLVIAKIESWQIKDDAEFPMWTKSFVGGAFHIDELVVQEEHWAKMNLERNRLKNIKFDTTFGIALRVAMVQFNRAMRDRATPQDPQWGPSKKYWYEPDNFLDMLGKSLNYRDLDKMSIAEMQEVYEFDQLVGRSFIDFFYSWSRTPRTRTTAELRGLIEKRIGNMTDKIKSIYPHLKRPYSDFANARDIAQSVFFYTLSTRSLWTSDATSLEAILLDDQVFRDMFFPVITRWLYLDRLPSQPVTALFEGYDDEKIRRVNQLFRSGAFLMQPERADRPTILNFGEIDFDLNKVQPEAYKLKMLLAKWQRTPRSREVDREFAKWATRWSVDVSLDLDLRTLSFIRYAKEQEWAVNPLVRWLEDMKYLISPAEGFTKKKLNLNKRTDFGYLSALRRSLIENLEFSREESALVLNLASPREKDQKVAVQVPDKANVEVPHFNFLARNLLYHMTRNKAWDPANEKEYDLTNSEKGPVLSGAILRLVMEGIQEGNFKETEDFVKQAVGFFEDNPKREKVIEYAGRLRRAFSGKMAFTARHLEALTLLPDDEGAGDVFGLILGLTRDYIGRGEDWRAWERTMERIVQLFEHSSREPDKFFNPMLDAFYIFQALRNNPAEYPLKDPDVPNPARDKKFDIDFAEFRKLFLTYDPGIQGWVMSWARSLVESGFTPARRQSRGLGKQVAEILVRMGVPKATAAANTYWQAFAESMDGTLPEITPAIVARRPEEASKTDLDVLGRFLALHQRAAQEGGWLEFQQQYRLEINYFVVLKGNREMRNRDLKSAEEFSKALYKDYKIPELTPRAVLTQRGPQSLFLGWAERQAKVVDEQLRREEAEKGKRSEMRLPKRREEPLGMTRRTFLQRGAQITATVATGAAFTAKAFPQGINPARRRAVDDLVMVRAASGQVIPGIEGGMPQRPRPLIPLNISGVWSEELEKILKDPKQRGELVSDAFILEKALKNEPVDLSTPEAIEKFLASDARKEFGRVIEPNNPMTSGTIIAWGTTRIDQGWKNTEGSAVRIAQVLLDRQKREVILKEAQALFDFRTAGRTIPIIEGLEQDDRAAKGLVVGWAHFRSEFEGDANQSWEETQGMADQLVQVLNGFENNKEKGARYFRAVAELYLLDKGLTPQNARRTAQAITSLKSFRPNKEAWSFLTGYTVALLIDVKNELAEAVEKIDPDEKLIPHTQNLLFMLANKRREIQEYYAGIGRQKEPLNPDHPDRTVRRRIWGEYAARLRMIEEIHGTYRLDEKIISQTLSDLLTVQKAANRKWRQLEDSEVAYFYRMFYTTRFERGQEKSYNELFKGLFSIEDFFELVTYDQGVRRDAGDGLIRELKFLEERGEKWPNALNRQDINGPEAEPGILDFIQGNARKEVGESLRNQPIREGEAVQTARYLLRERQKMSPDKWLRLEQARQKLLKESRWEMMLMSVYMLYHRDEKGFPERLNLPDLSSWVTLIRKEIYGPEEKSLATLSAFLKYDGLFIQLEKKAQAAIAAEIGGAEGVEAAKRFPVMDPGRRLGLVVRLHRLKKNDTWLRRYFEDLVKMQLSFYKHQNKRFIEASLAYYALDRFREGNDALSDAQERRMNGYFVTSANEDLIYQDLGVEGNELRRFLLDYQSVFHEVPSEETQKEGRAIASRFDVLIPDLPVNEREALQIELSTRLQMADKNFVRALADQVYQLAGDQFLIPYLSTARSRVKKVLTEPIRDENNQAFTDSEGKHIGTGGPLLELVPRLSERKKKAAVIREKTEAKTSLLEPLWDKAVQERRKRKGTLPDGETEESMILKIQALYRDYLAKPENQNKGYSAGLRRGLLLHMVNSMIEQGYTLEENFLKNVELKNRVASVYRKAYGIAEGKALARTQEFTVSALASRIFSDWGVSLDPERVEKGIQDELKHLEQVLIVSRQISGALNRIGKSLTDLEAYRMADNSINSGVDIGEIRVWVEVARQIMAIAREITVRGKALEISVDQALYLADSWLKIGLAEDVSFREWNEQELRGPVSSELARLGITKPDVAAAIVRRMDEREIAPVELKLLVDHAIELEQSRQQVIGLERRRSLWSDREMAPQKIFELMRGLSGLDMLVYLDNVSSQPDTYLGLQDILGVSMEEIEKRIEPPINAMRKVEVETILKAKVPAEIRNRARSWIESERDRLWQEEGWGNIHTWFAGTAVLGALSLVFRGLLTLRHNRQNREAEARTRVTPRQFVYYWLNQVITLSMVFFIMIGLNFSFANAPSTILLWGVTLYYLLLIIPDIYLLSAITAFVVEPFYRSVVAPAAKIVNPSVRPSLLHPYSGGELVQNPETGNYEIVEKGSLTRILDEQKFMVSVAFPMRGESKPITQWADINNFNVIFGDLATGHIGEGERQLAEAQAAGDFNLYYAVILQAFPKKDTATEQEAREYYEQVLNLVESRLNAMPENVRSRLYVFVRPAKLTKPITHYMLQEWMVQNDDDYVRVEPEYNVDPDYTAAGDYRFQRRAPKPAGEVIDRRIPFTHVLGGNPADPNDLRNTRERNIVSDADVNRRTNEIFATLVYDPGNSITYRGILDFLSVARDPRNSNIMYIATMDYSDKYATLHTLIMKWFPQRMLRYPWYSQAIVQEENRPPGKYLYVNIEKQVAERNANGQLIRRTVPGFYRQVIRSRAYEKIWPFYGDSRASDDILPKSEDELMGILSGGAKLVPQVTILEDPMVNYAQEWIREVTRWMFVFDQPQIMVLRIVPFIRDHPFLAALLVGFIPSFVLLGIIGTSLMTLLIWTTAASGAALILLGSRYNRASQILRELESSGRMKIPKLTPGEKKESDLVIRGLISELVWFTQLAVTIKAMLVPGTIEILFPFMGEVAFISIMALLLHPKFHQVLLYLFTSLRMFVQGFLVFFRVGELYRDHGMLGIVYAPIYSIRFFIQAVGFLLLGLVEFVASSTIFLPKLIMKPIALMVQFPKVMIITYFNIFGEYPKSVQLIYRYILRQPVPTTPLRLTWNAAVVGAENPLFIEYLNIFKWPFSIMLLTLTALIPGYAPISFLLGAGPYLIGISGTVTILTFLRGTMFGDYKKSARQLSVFFIAAGMLMLASSLYPGVIPRELILRASTILIASFGFASGWAWLFGLGRRTGGRPQESRLIPLAAYALGVIIVAMMIGATFLPIEVISVVSKFPVFSFVIPGMDGAVYMYWFSMSDQLHLPWYFVIFYTTILANSVMIGILASIAGLIHSAFVTGGKALPKVRALGWAGATAVLLGLGRILGLGKEEAPPAVRPVATAPVVQEGKIILPGTELARKPGEEIPPVPPVRSEVREAKGTLEFLAALDSKREMELELLKATAFASIREAREAGLEDKLRDQLTRFAASPEIRSRLNLGTPSEKVAAQGYYLLEYKQDYSIAFIRQLINRRPEEIKIVIFADASDAALLRTEFAADLGEQFNVLAKTELESFLNTKRRELRLAVSDVIHLRTQFTAELLKQGYETRVLAGLLDAAKEGIAVASDKPIEGAREFTFYDAIIQSFSEILATSISA